jgi:NTP pyrophosphatase (non-canonical NTP hydrolase)
MMALTREELLVILIEECGEVIQAATKCLRFGYDRRQPDYGVNSEVLAKEVGDLIGVVDALPLDRQLIEDFRKIKVRKATRVKSMVKTEVAPQPLSAYR